MERLKKKELLFLILIIALSIFFRFFLLDQADMVGDESTYSFRAFGYLDSFVSSGQVTSIDWFDIPPWWSKLSFHDHPPLSFILNKIFLNLFGPTPFAARFLVALAGVFSTFLIYLISQKWYGENVGLLAALFFAINNFTVWIGRVGLQESLLIALVLTSLYFFILAQEKKTLLYFSALFLGLAFLTKYTAIFVLPFYLVSIFVKNKDWLKHKEFYLSLLLFLVVISPVLIYNVLLYKTFGHFDLQLSYLFNLNQVAGWDKLPGKSDLALGQGLIDLPKNLATLTSPAFIIILVLALVYFILFKKPRNEINYWGILVILVSLIGLIILTGPQERFLILFLPFFVLIISTSFIKIISQKRFFYFGLILLLFFGVYEAFYTINNFLLIKPIGSKYFTYSDYLKTNRGNWGFNNLDKYLNDEFKGKVPAQRFSMADPYLEEIVARNFEKAKGEEVAALIIYDFNIEHGPDIWYLQRRQFYLGWPLITADVFVKALDENGQNYYLDQGFKQFYFIQATTNVLLRDKKDRNDTAEKLGQSLRSSGIEPVVITDLLGQTSFLVYNF